MELQFTSGPNLPHNTLSCALSSVAPPLMISELEDNEGLIMCLISHAGPNGSLTHLDKVSLLICSLAGSKKEEGSLGRKCVLCTWWTLSP